MQKNLKISVISIAIIAMATALCLTILKAPLSKAITSLYLSKKLNCSISMRSCDLSITKGLTASDVKITNRKGLKCSIKDVDIKGNFLNYLKGELVLDILLKDVGFSYSESEIVNGIAKLFSIKSKGLLRFSSVTGVIYIKKEELVVKDLNAKGDDVSILINGTSIGDDSINYKFNLKLSKEMTAKIPKAARVIFFREEDEFSTVELYLSGNPEKPSINFSSPLFKLLVR